jgi:hypothetical protein
LAERRLSQDCHLGRCAGVSCGWFASASARKIFESYARRMNIEPRLAEAIQPSGLDTLASAVPLNADLDVLLSVLAHTLRATLRHRLPGYHTATPDTLQRHFLPTGGTIISPGDQITVRSTGAPTHPSSARPACPKRSPCLGGVAAPSTTSTPDPRPGPVAFVKIGRGDFGKQIGTSVHWST